MFYAFGYFLRHFKQNDKGFKRLKVDKGFWFCPKKIAYCYERIYFQNKV